MVPGTFSATTRLTSRPGTTISLTDPLAVEVRPHVGNLARGGQHLVALGADGITTSPRSLPLTWTA